MNLKNEKRRKKNNDIKPIYIYEKSLNTLGSIKEILLSEKLLKYIVDYPEKELLFVFINKVNYLIKKGLEEKYLEILRSDFLINEIMNLFKNQSKLMHQEIAQKINYLTLIKDEASLEANFINSEFIKIMCENIEKKELQYFIISGEIYHNTSINFQLNLGLQIGIYNYKYGLYIIKTAKDFYDRNIDNEEFKVKNKKGKSYENS